MSGTGVGEVLGVLVGAAYLGGKLVIGAAYLAGKSLYLAGKGAIIVGKGVYKLHKANQNRRLRKAQEEFIAVEGELGKIARDRMLKMATMEQKLFQDYEEAVDDREKRLEKSYEALTGTETKLEDVALALPDYYSKKVKAINKEIDSEIGHFSDDMNELCNTMVQDISQHIEQKKQSTKKTLDSIEKRMDERIAGWKSEAQLALDESSSLMNVLRKNYDCKTFAPTELEIAEEQEKKVREYLASDNEAYIRAAAMAAADLEERALILQVRAEQRTAIYEHQKAVLEAKAAELKKVAEATHDIIGESGSALSEYVTEEQDANYWSEGRLSKLWDEADALAKKVDSYSYQDGQDALILAKDMESLQIAMEQEHARARSFILSRMILSKLALDTIESLKNEGWELVADPEYQITETGEADARMPIILRFERNEDEMEVVLSDEYDETTGQYKQRFTRLSNEKGTVDEHKRQNDDLAFSEAMQRLGNIGFSVSCDESTSGLKKKTDW